MGCQQVRKKRFLFSEAIEFGYFLEQGNSTELFVNGTSAMSWRWMDV
jgi:hypothetical protein